MIGQISIQMARMEHKSIVIASPIRHCVTAQELLISGLSLEMLVIYGSALMLLIGLRQQLRVHQYLRCVATDNTTIVAVGTGGAAYVSQDGTTWRNTAQNVSVGTAFWSVSPDLIGTGMR